MTNDTNDTSINYQQFFTKLLEAAPWPIIIIDCKLSIYFYNQRCVHLLEAAEPLQGLSLEQIIHERVILQFVRESIQTGQVCNDEFTMDPSGTAWRVSVTPLEYEKRKKGAKEAKDAEEEQMADDPEASIHGYFAIAIEDLTELRRLERVRRDFIANISHELRTPLASVRLLAETLEEAIDTDRENAQMFLEKIENEVQHLDALVSELLELSRIESGLVPMVIEPVEAERLVREVMARMLPQAQRHRVTLRTDIGEGNILVAADSKQVARVLVNLVHNAIKFTPSGGTVTIGTAIQARGRSQQFFVRDTGVGIRPEELPRVFERFYKADYARSKTDFIGPGGGGSGLGLAIARHVVEALGGRITAESRIGHGSTFTFTLPVAVRKGT
jgi:two-component system, OmpR family, phosphate regulon sensor histidine kinase PhoR